MRALISKWGNMTEAERGERHAAAEREAMAEFTAPDSEMQLEINAAIEAARAAKAAGEAEEPDANVCLGERGG